MYCSCYYDVSSETENWFLNVYLIEDVQVSELIIYFDCVRYYNYQRCLFSYYLVTQISVGHHNLIVCLFSRLCFMFLLGENNIQDSTNFLSWYGIHRHSLAPILLELLYWEIYSQFTVCNLTADWKKGIWRLKCASAYFWDSQICGPAWECADK